MPSDRAYLLRLTPDRALESLDDAEAWVRERGLVTLLPSTSLPSLFAACHEEPYSEHARGFGSRLKTEVVVEQSHRGARAALRQAAARHGRLGVGRRSRAGRPAVSRGEFERARGRGARRVLPARRRAPGGSRPDAHAGGPPKGSTSTAAHSRNVRKRLERAGAVVARPARIELRDGGHRHASGELALGSAGAGAQAAGTVSSSSLRRGCAGVRAAVAAPEREVRWRGSRGRRERT